MKLSFLVVLALVGCASVPAPSPCWHRYTDVSVTAPGWALPLDSHTATTQIVVHNPRAVMVEVELGCGMAGGKLARNVVRLGAGMEQVLHFSIPRVEYRTGTFTCQVTGVEPFNAE